VASVHVFSSQERAGNHPPRRGSFFLWGGGGRDPEVVTSPKRQRGTTNRHADVKTAKQDYDFRSEGRWDLHPRTQDRRRRVFGDLGAEGETTVLKHFQSKMPLLPSRAGCFLARANLAPRHKIKIGFADLRFSQISAIRGRLFRLIFTCESSQPHALGSGAGALHRIRSCGRGCAFSKLADR
jgi:hypothetical protein